MDNTTTNNDDAEWAAAIADRVGRWRLLYAVPFNYLVPDTRLLPPESIRFFQLDDQWVDCLVDGAFSLGRATAGDAALDAGLGQRHAAQAHRAARQVRAQLTGEEPPGFTPGDPGPVTGFLLRSGAVSGWPGLQVECYGGPKPKDPLPLLRMSRLDGKGGEVLLCLFHGILQEVYLHPPAEGLHFGVDEPMEQRTSYTKGLRYTADIGTHAIGDQITDAKGKNIAIDVPLRDGDKRVLDFAGLAQSIHDGLTTAEGPALKQWTAAEAGLEMVEGVDEVSFTVTP